MTPKAPKQKRIRFDPPTPSIHTLWQISGLLVVLALAIGTYFFGLDSLQIPKNGDEFPYAHIARLTADSGHWLPLQSALDNMRNTKPPLLFWQGILSTHWGQDWSLWQLRYPNVLYTWPQHYSLACSAGKSAATTSARVCWQPLSGWPFLAPTASAGHF